MAFCANWFASNCGPFNAKNKEPSSSWRVSVHTCCPELKKKLYTSSVELKSGILHKIKKPLSYPLKGFRIFININYFPRPTGLPTRVIEQRKPSHAED